MALVDAKELVDLWAAPWKGGATPAAVSALDVLVGDVLEARWSRPAGRTVTATQVDAAALSRWMLDWPRGPGFFTRLLGMNRRWAIYELDTHSRESGGRYAQWKELRASVGDIRWPALADMEVVSLAMGHVGPSRQPTILPMIEAWLCGIAAEFAGQRLADKHLEDSARHARLGYAVQAEELAAISSRAIEELASRAVARGAPVADPFALEIPAYLPLLGGRLV